MNGGNMVDFVLQALQALTCWQCMFDSECWSVYRQCGVRCTPCFVKHFLCQHTSRLCT